MLWLMRKLKPLDFSRGFNLFLILCFTVYFTMCFVLAFSSLYSSGKHLIKTGIPSLISSISSLFTSSKPWFSTHAFICSIGSSKGLQIAFEVLNFFHHLVASLMYKYNLFLLMTYRWFLLSISQQYLDLGFLLLNIKMG